jgi:putative ABC transport system permease protein
MNMLIRLSWRNIWRNKVRSLVVIIAVAVGITGGIFIIGTMNGMVNQQTDSIIHNEISHIQIHHPRFNDNLNPSLLINHVDKKIKSLQANARVAAISYRSKATAMATTANTGAGVVIMGIEPEIEKKITNIHNKIIEGSYFEKATKSNPIIIGQKLSETLGVKINSKVVITLQAIDGEITWLLFRVAGIFKTNDTRFDEMNVFVLANDLNKAIGIDSGLANEIAILSHNRDEAVELAEELQTVFPGLSVQSWKELRPSLIVVLVMMEQMGYWLMVIILVALVFGIINTMLMVIMERKRELGMLMSVGMNRRRIFSLILLETSLLSMVGAFSGLSMGIALIAVLGKTGINFGMWAEGLESVGYSAFVYPEVSVSFYITITILVLFTAITASVWPTRKALNLDPAQAVREE